MIRSLQLLCSECGQEFIPEKELYYRDNYLNANLRDTKFICPACIRAWQEKWQIRNAVFTEKDYVLTVTLELEDGTVYENMDCTAIDETQSVITGTDIPPAAQRKLYGFYAQWDRERKAHYLKDCTFTDEFMRSSFSCVTYGGEEFTNVAFRFNIRGEMETERPVPEYIRRQVLAAYKLHEAAQADLQAGE